MLRLRLSYLLSKKRLSAPSVTPHPVPSTSGYEYSASSGEGDLGAAMEVNLPGTYSRTFHSSARSVPLVELPGTLGGSPVGEIDFSFGAPADDEVSLAASGGRLTPSDAEGLAELLPSGIVAQSEPDADMSIGLENIPPPSPKHSLLDVWFLGSEHCCSVPRQASLAPPSSLPSMVGRRGVRRDFTQVE